MILKSRIVFFWLIFFSLSSNVFSEISFKIIMKVDNEIIIQRLVEVSSKGIEIYEKLKQEFVDK